MYGSPILFLIDENVPNSVARFLSDRGHDVRFVREVLLPATPDQVVAASGDLMGAVIITWNAKDFRKLAARRSAEGRQRFRQLGRIVFTCNEARGRERIEANIERIEFEFALAQRSSDRRLMLQISERTCTVIG